MPRFHTSPTDRTADHDSQVLDNRAMRVAQSSVPVISRRRPEVLMFLNTSYRFTDALTNTTFNMNVDGSVTPVVFEIPRVEDRQLTFTSIRIVIEGDDLDISNRDRKEFGTAGLLTNGITFSIFLGSARGTFQFFPFPVTKIEDLLLFSRLGSVRNSLKDGPNAPDQLTLELEIATPVIFAHIGTSDVLSFTINDDLTSLGRFEMIAFGHEDFR